MFGVTINVKNVRTHVFSLSHAKNMATQREYTKWIAKTPTDMCVCVRGGGG